MNDLDDAGLTDVLGSLRYKSPSLEELWQPSPASARRSVRVGVAVGLSVLAVLVLSLGALATSGWFNQFSPNGVCAPTDSSCGPDFERAAIAVDHTVDVTMVNVLVKPGLTHDRLTAIAQAMAAQQSAHRVIVYLFGGLPSGETASGFRSVPAGDDAPPLPPLTALQPYLRLTYDTGPGGLHAIWP